MSRATAHMGSGRGSGCPLGYGMGKNEGSKIHSDLLGAFQKMLPSCDEQSMALYSCRVAVSKAGSGHCANEALEVRRCKAEREKRRRQVLQSCGGERPDGEGGGPWLSLEDMFEACLASNTSASGECEAKVGTFLKCAGQVP